MSSTSKKHRSFISEPMGDKPVKELAGVGDVYGSRLTEKNYDKAYVVLGQFLLFKKDELLFKDWLKDICGMSAKHANDCHDCLRDWCLAFL